ncbi:hypothetical protein [Hydrogenophaga sp.]|uniref:hypothetical protein n=1 Tax=Hydrogenophaga sp. TaxID=1904254 RepID=UPI003F73126E
MSKREAIHTELAALYQEGTELAVSFQKKKEKQFHYDYQKWYTKALKAVEALALDRHSEFRSYYEVDPKRKALGYGTYVIQDYLKGVAPGSYHLRDFDIREEVLKCFLNQLTILKAIEGRIDSVLSNIEGEIYAELQDNEIAQARELLKISPRAAGALVGVVIEGHLQKVATARGVKIAKKHPTIADLNDPLKAASVIDIPAWRKISFLADLRNLCSHKKDAEPTKAQVEELIDGAEWLTKNVF